MSKENSCQPDVAARFDEKLRKLEKVIPELNLSTANCAELTLTSVLEILGIDNFFFHNLVIPLAGGFGGYKSKKSWMGACGAVSGGCTALGIVIGGPTERMRNSVVPTAYLKASSFCSDFEKQFGSVVCSEICGHDLSTPRGMLDYQKNDTWRKICCKFVLWAVDEVRKLTRKELNANWE